MSYHKSLQGVGWISIVPSGSYPDPVHLAEVESLDFTVNEDTADLEDANGDVIDTVVTKRTIEGSVSIKDFSGSLLAVATRGVTVTTNRPIGYTHSAAVPGSVAYTVQVPVTNPTRTFTRDLGVINLTSAKQMPRTDSGTTPASGGYVVDTSTGIYTFHADQANASVLISYIATPSTADGITADVATAVGTVSYYGLHCFNSTAAKPWGIYIPAAFISGLSGKFSKKGWVDTTFKFKATKDSSNKLSYVYTAE